MSIEAETKQKAWEKLKKEINGPQLKLAGGTVLSVWEVYKFDTYPEITFCNLNLKKDELKEIHVCHEGKTVVLVVGEPRMEFSFGLWGNEPQEVFEKKVDEILLRNK